MVEYLSLLLRIRCVIYRLTIYRLKNAEYEGRSNFQNVIPKRTSTYEARTTTERRLTIAVRWSSMENDECG